ncbi:phage repressor protein C with HTH and peptisase S24 domain [Paraburkholderia unamae]|uniref:Phage repressor protein C with HTH and peptisase S24 domain n=2 Tax=Paraburkholderia unamae TaxID=219649 RepID=A0ABX5K8X3_9BURK|nr:phage repressor protein C with HTH and peptisase S24 domain [Paraburkholderia unamae]
MVCAGLNPRTDQSALARQVPCKPQVIQYLLDHDKNAKGSKYTIRIADVLKCDPRWLADGLGKAPTQSDLVGDHKTSQSDTSISTPDSDLFGERLLNSSDTLVAGDLPNPTADEFAIVPQLDIAAACGNGRFEDHVVVKGGLAFKKTFLREYGVPEHSARIIYAEGASMYPKIQDGRVVLLNTAQRDPIEGKIFAVCMPDGGLVLKRLVREYYPPAGSTVWIMRSDNPDKTEFPDKMLPPDDRTLIIGRAVWTDNIL